MIPASADLDLEIPEETEWSLYEAVRRDVSKGDHANIGSNEEIIHTETTSQGGLVIWTLAKMDEVGDSA